MRLLLDTHIALWWWSDDPQLPRRLRAAIADPTNEIHVSAVSAWEIVLKERLGKLDGLRGIGAALGTLMQADRFRPLALSFQHGQRAGGYAMAHRDPFDRMLAAQAEIDDIPLATRDDALAEFPGPRWR